MVLARGLTVLALLIGFVSMLAFTLERTVLEESGIERIATDLIQDDDIREQVALTAVEQLYANVDVEARIAARLPEAQQALAPTLTALSRQAADQAADRLLERPRVQAAWVEVQRGPTSSFSRSSRTRGGSSAPGTGRSIWI